MAAGIYNITVDQGSDYSTTLVVSGQTLDGYSARGQVRPSIGSETLSAEFTFTITGGTSTGGTILAELTNIETKKMLPGTYVYDIEVFNTTTNKAVRLIQGTVTVVGGVTQS